MLYIGFTMCIGVDVTFFIMSKTDSMTTKVCNVWSLHPWGTGMHGEVLSHETFVCSKWCISVALLLGTGLKGANYAKPKPTYINIFLTLPLRAVLRRWGNFLHTLEIIKTTDAVLSLIPHDALSTLTPECVPKSGSLLFSSIRASAAVASVSSTILHSPSCRKFYGVTSLLSTAKKIGTKSSPEDDEEVVQLSEAIIRRVK